MKKEYILKKLDCSACGNKIENALKNTRGITSAELNFISLTLKVTTDDSIADLKKIVEKIVNTYEPDVNVVEKNKRELKSIETEIKELPFLIIGVVLFLMGILFSSILHLNEKVILITFICSYLLLGGKVILKAVRNIFKGQIFDENFLMSIATIGAFAIGDEMEAVSVMLFYQIGEYFQDLAVKKSKESVVDLMNIHPDYANLLVNKEIKQVAPEEVQIDDIIIIKPGEKIPLDASVIDGESFIDTSALTGESVPVNVMKGDDVLSGCMNQTGVLTCKVTKEYGESTVSKIIDLIENANSKKASTENFITTFSKYYTPIVVIIAVFLITIPPLFFNANWISWINRGLIFLVISCPCALVLSIPLSYFGGIGNASKKGILIKGSNYLEALNNLEIVAFDKTGTLTKGKFEVTDIICKSHEKEELLEYAALAESFSNHPIANAIVKHYAKQIDRENIKDYQEIAGYGTSITYNNKKILVGNDKLMRINNIEFEEEKSTGTKVYIALDNKYVGCIIISDEIKEDSYKTIMELKKLQMKKLVMLTGDNKKTAEEIASKLKIDSVYAELLPHEKVEIIERLLKSKTKTGKLAFIGDGINDAPVLARSDIGIAMGGLGTDAAIEASDIIFMTDELSKLPVAIKIAKFTKKIVWQNIIFALGIKIIFLILGAFGNASMWEAVFADVGVSVIAVFNAIRVLKMK